jgi:hypothetical protein
MNSSMMRTTLTAAAAAAADDVPKTNTAPLHHLLRPIRTMGGHAEELWLSMMQLATPCTLHSHDAADIQTAAYAQTLPYKLGNCLLQSIPA